MVAVCIGLLTCDASMALGGNSGGGKNSSRGRFVVVNDGPNDVRVLIQPTGSAFPTTLGAVQANSFVVQAGTTNNGVRRNSGDFDIFVIDATDFATGIGFAGAAAPSGGPGAADDSSTAIPISGSDITVSVASDNVVGASITQIDR